MKTLTVLLTVFGLGAGGTYLYLASQANKDYLTVKEENQFFRGQYRYSMTTDPVAKKLREKEAIDIISKITVAHHCPNCNLSFQIDDGRMQVTKPSPPPTPTPLAPSKSADVKVAPMPSPSKKPSTDH